MDELLPVVGVLFVLFIGMFIGNLIGGCAEGSNHQYQSCATEYYVCIAHTDERLYGKKNP